MKRLAFHESMKKRIMINVICLLLAVLLSGCGKPRPDATFVSDNTEIAAEGQNYAEDIAKNSQTETEIISEPEAEGEQEDEKGPESAPQISLVMVGDVLMHSRVMESGYSEDGTYNFDHIFANLRETFEGADLALVNQETILGGTELGLSDYPCFNSPCEVGDAEVKAGFDVVLSATNHTLDKGAAGVNNCLNFWENTYPEIEHLGLNADEHEQQEIYVFEKDGISIAILNYTYGTNGINTPSGMEYCVNYLTEERVKRDVARAKELANFVMVCPHWGTEYRLEPDQAQRRWCQLFLECGVDLVIGTHPHVIEPIEWYEGEDGHRMLVYYSLGNYINGTSSTGDGIANRMVGGMAEISIGYDESGEVSILDYDVVPLVCHEAEGSGYTVYRLANYTENLAADNLIVEQDPNFSKAYCEDLVNQVWGLAF